MSTTDDAGESVAALKREIHDLRTAVIHVASLSNSRRDVDIEIAAIRHVANHTGEPFSLARAEAKVVELKRSDITAQEALRKAEAERDDAIRELNEARSLHRKDLREIGDDLTSNMRELDGVLQRRIQMLFGPLLGALEAWRAEHLLGAGASEIALIAEFDALGPRAEALAAADEKDALAAKP